MKRSYLSKKKNIAGAIICLIVIQPVIITMVLAQSSDNTEKSEESDICLPCDTSADEKEYIAETSWEFPTYPGTLSPFMLEFLEWAFEAKENWDMILPLLGRPTREILT